MRIAEMMCFKNLKESLKSECEEKKSLSRLPFLKLENNKS